VLDCLTFKITVTGNTPKIFFSAIETLGEIKG
jgi:hypothetical protein